jgi:uncharacterized repeat protein (TIGR03803 family)
LVPALVLVTVIASFGQTYTPLYNFCSLSNCTDGGRPTGALIQGADGGFYGTTVSGGTNGVGTVFKITSGGALNTLHSFNDADGLNPFAGLIQAGDGNFYGTTFSGGHLTLGNVFKMTPNGMVSPVYSFCNQQGCTDGANPYAPLVQGSDGNFYGTTQMGGNGSCSGLGVGCGTVFKVTPAGALTTLHAFAGADGIAPYAGLTQGSDGNFYGTTQYGGAAANCPSFVTDGCGTIFRITPSGTLTTLYNFCSQLNCTDGYGTYAGLLLAADGNFYGTSHYGGAHGDGTIFRITPGGAFTTLHAFTGYPNDGANPIGGLMQATDGNFYGTTPSGGAHFLGGTIFQMTPNGTVTTLYSFCALTNCDDGASPYDVLLQATDGNIYGTASMGGVGCNGGFCGTVFKLSLGLGQFVSIQPTSGAVGTPVTIQGMNLSGATSVKFNGTAANFTVVSSGQITTTVPARATTGTVQVTTPSGMLNSHPDFRVTGPLQLVSVAPCRLVDTRQTGGPIQGGTSRNFNVPQFGGCNIPASAAAYSLNVTVVPHGRLGFLTIWPAGQPQPNVSTMNSPDGRVKANAAIVPAGNNAVSVYVTDTTDVILDIDGYLAPAAQNTLQFYPLTPCRVVDTRNPNGPLGGPRLPAQQERDFPLLMSTTCIPSGLNPAAYSLNFTVVPNPAGQRLGYLSVWPTGQPQPVVSTLNNPTGTTVANAAIVPAGTGGQVAVYASATTDLLVDINGYFAAPGAGGYSFYPVAPCRVDDTRNNIGPFSGEIMVNVVGSPCAPPSNTTGYVFNATVIPSPRLGFLTLWPDGQTQPVVSTLNAGDGAITSNLAIVPNVNGTTDAFAGNGTTQLILDLSGYFAP